MTTLGWILISGSAMSALALVGALTTVLSEATLQRVILPAVGLAAGTLLGGAFFHMLPESVEALGNGLWVYVWVVAGFIVFFVLEQFLHWHHCHKSARSEHPASLQHTRSLKSSATSASCSTAAGQKGPRSHGTSLPP
jgi:zinc and cadmium transporter